MGDGMTPANRDLYERIWEAAAQHPRKRWAEAMNDLIDAARAEGPAWRTLDTVPCDGSLTLLSAPSWDGVVERAWRSRAEADADLANWSDPPTHWMPSPSPPSAEGSPA